MSIANKVNFKKGWPSSTIVEAVAQPASGVTTLEAGKIGHLDTATPPAWVLGITQSAVGFAEQPYVFHNDQTDGDVGNRSSDQFLSNPVQWGGVQGISFSNPIEVETTQFAGTPEKGDGLYAASTGKLTVGATAAAPSTSTGGGDKLIIAICTEARHTYQNQPYITFIPTAPRLVA